mmetsp:Transcript_64818/g.200713  ORF Transcript_64818/g.200713 Transcript_64818/m.200713 type:complete len:329 (-) Transcript_64818:283-1269(-)
MEPVSLLRAFGEIGERHSSPASSSSYRLGWRGTPPMTTRGLLLAADSPGRLGVGDTGSASFGDSCDVGVGCPACLLPAVITHVPTDGRSCQDAGAAGAATAGAAAAAGVGAIPALTFPGRRASAWGAFSRPAVRSVPAEPTSLLRAFGEMQLAPAKSAPSPSSASNHPRSTPPMTTRDFLRAVSGALGSGSAAICATGASISTFGALAGASHSSSEPSPGSSTAAATSAAMGLLAGASDSFKSNSSSSQTESKSWAMSTMPWSSTSATQSSTNMVTKSFAVSSKPKSTLSFCVACGACSDASSCSAGASSTRGTSRLRSASVGSASGS